MAWIRDLFSRLPPDIKASLAFPKRASFDDITLPPRKKAKVGASSSEAPLEDLPVQSGKFKNEHVYEVASPSHGQPSVELVFFHGLQLKDSPEHHEAHLGTWRSNDGKELSLNWILDEDKFPRARILTVSFDAHAEKTEKDGHMDMYLTTENLVQDLTQAGVGQNQCPVVLVGHCIGGLVMKQLCVSATEKVVRTSDVLTEHTRKFLGNVRGLFFYATPHCGTRLAEKDDFTKGSFLENSAPLNTEAARQRDKFSALRQKKDWKTCGMGESQEVTVGSFRGLMVPEASARCDMGDFYTAKANHFDICRPSDRTSSSFTYLIDFVKGVVYETKGQIHDEEPVHECVELPLRSVGLDTRSQEVQEKLKGGAVLGIFGMGGIGKTTLAREVFNNIAKDFEYTCFIDNVKGFKIEKLRKSILNHFYRNGTKSDWGRTQWSQMKGKKALIVMDDTDSEDQLRVLPQLQHFGEGSCLVITGRNRGVFKVHENCIIYDVRFLNRQEATQLFCNHAFGSDDVPQDKFEHLRKHVNAVVKKCDGLPLTLEVMGRYLRNEASSAVWVETIDSLQKVNPIDGGRIGDDIVWAKLELSYNKLSEDAQEMFLDAATVFFEERVETFLAARSGRKAETTWKNLVDRALVKESEVMPWLASLFRKVADSPRVWVHEQWRDLATKLAKSRMLSGTGGEVDSLVKLLHENDVNPNTKSLRLLHRSKGPTAMPALRVDSLVRLEQLEYMTVDGVLLDGEATSLPGNLRLLRCFSGRTFGRSIPVSFPISLSNLDHLAVLELTGYVFQKDFPATFQKMLNLRHLRLHSCEVPEGFHEALGHLKNLHILSLSLLEGPMHSLPENLGNLGQLKQLDLVLVDSVKLPKSFGQLTSLEVLSIEAGELETLPDCFGPLTSIRRLRLICPRLETLPYSFRELRALEEMLIDCQRLKCMGDGFGQLASLKHVTIRSAELEALPDNFGDLESVRKLTLHLGKLKRLPNTFGGLCSLEDLKIECPELQSLGDTFGQLANLKVLIISRSSLAALPENFGSLTSLRQLILVSGKLDRLPASFEELSLLEDIAITCPRLQRLCDDFGKLASLKKLTIVSYQLKTLPHSLGALQSLRTVSLLLPKLERLPADFGSLSSLDELTIRCPQLKSLWDDFSHLAILKELTIESDELETLPRNFVIQESLRKVSLKLPKLERLPDSFGSLKLVQEMEMSLNCPLPLDFSAASLESLKIFGCCKLSSSFGCSFGQLKVLEISCDELETLPENVGTLKSVQDMSLKCPKLKRLPESFAGLASLARLTLNCSGLTSLSDSFGHLATLQQLTILSDELEALPHSFKSLSTTSSNSFNLKSLPAGFGKLSMLEHLSIDCPKLKSLSPDFGELTTLRYLTIRCAELDTLPHNFNLLKSVRDITLRCPKLERLPDHFGGLSSLQILSIDCRKLQSLPDDFGLLTSLNDLTITSDELQNLPESFGSLEGVRRVQFNCSNLKVLPDSFARLSALERLQLHGCHELHVPPGLLGQLANLEDLAITRAWESTLAQTLCDSLAELEALRDLKIGSVSLRSIPDCIRNCRALETLTPGPLPYVKDLPPWLGETGTTPVAIAEKFFWRRDGQFSLTSEKDPFRTTAGNPVEHLFWELYKIAAKKVRALDYEGALGMLCLDSLGLVLPPWLQGFVLRETGIIKRKQGDLARAWDDLTAALRVFSGADELGCYAYDCWRHRGFVNFLLGKLDDARYDGEMALKHKPDGEIGLKDQPYDRDPAGHIGEESVRYLDFVLIGKKEQEYDLKEIKSSHVQVMEKVRVSDFAGALALWETLEVKRLPSKRWQVYFLQEMGILKRFLGDLNGALEDLTAALEINHNDYGCLKHRAYVKYLLNDLSGAQKDVEQCHAFRRPESSGNTCLGTLSVAFMDFTL